MPLEATAASKSVVLMMLLLKVCSKSPPTVSSEGVSRAKPLVCRRSYGQARHGGGFGDRQKDSALNWVNRDRRVFAVVVCVSALIDLDAAKTSAFECGVHLGGFLASTFHEDVREVHLHLGWDSALHPVLYSLDAANGFIELSKGGYLCRPAELFNQFCVIHAHIKHHV